MAENDDKPSTTKIDPTRALLQLLPKLTAHAAAVRLTTALHSNDCRLWCNGNLLPPQYIATALRLIAVPEVDGRWRGEIVSAVREAWEPGTYIFELDETEVAAVAAPRTGSIAASEAANIADVTATSAPAIPPPAPQAPQETPTPATDTENAPKIPRGRTELWIYNALKTDPSLTIDVLEERCPYDVTRKTLQNCVSLARKALTEAARKNGRKEQEQKQ
jgi:hypothetical protein